MSEESADARQTGKNGKGEGEAGKSAKAAAAKGSTAKSGTAKKTAEKKPAAKKPAVKKAAAKTTTTKAVADKVAADKGAADKGSPPKAASTTKAKSASKAASKPATEPASTAAASKVAGSKTTASKASASKASASKAGATKAGATKASTPKGPAKPKAGAGDIPRPWLDHYPDYVAHEIDEGAVPDLTGLYDHAVSRFADRVAFESFGVGVSYKDLDRHVRAVAAWLAAQGYGKGDRIAVMMPNVMAYPAILFGILKAGCIVVNVNPLYTVRELQHQIRDSGAKALFVLENFASTVERSGLAKTELDKVVIVAPGDLLGLKGFIVTGVSRYLKRGVPRYSLPDALRLTAVLRSPGPDAYERRAVEKDDIAFLQYTGGTTGLSKGATLLHRNVAMNVAQVEAWLRHEMEARKVNGIITALPLYHIFSLMACMLFFHFGARQVLIANPRDIPGLIDTLKKTPFNCVVFINTLYNALANHPRIKEVDFSQLHISIAGGMTTQKAVATKWKALTGTPIVEGYGLSETSPVVTANRLDIDEFTGAIGYPLSSTEVSIRDEEGKPLGFEEPGEICVRGPQVMKGYWNQPDETSKVMTEDGFLRTGDVGVLQEDGLVRIVDRIKDTVVVSGFNVYPNEVEGVLSDHPQIAESAVIGVPDEHSGERVVAYVVRRDEAVTEQEIREHCKESLTSYKVPREIRFRDELPKTNVGKVLRRALRDTDDAGG